MTGGEMKKRTELILEAATTVGVLAAGPLAIARARRREHGWGSRTKYGRQYEPNRLEELKGMVHSITRFGPSSTRSEGIQLVLETEHGLVQVHLGPTRWLAGLAERLKPGETVEVLGCHVHNQYGTYIMAARVRDGHHVRELRDARGRPLWRKQLPPSTTV
jgi:hypothetical protein